jgi:hypothetical protein
MTGHETAEPTEMMISVGWNSASKLCRRYGRVQCAWCKRLQPAPATTGSAQRKAARYEASAKPSPDEYVKLEKRLANDEVEPRKRWRWRWRPPCRL